jgi:ParB family chromosome partitioning protein
MDTPITTIRNVATARPLPVASIEIPEDGLRRAAVTPEQEAGMLDSVRALGVLQPIIVRPHHDDADRWLLVAGRRRLRAALAVGLDNIAAVVRADLTDADALAIEAAENMQRAAMAPIDQWRAMERLRGLGWDLDGAADALGIPRRLARRLSKLGQLHPTVLAAIETSGEMPAPRHLAIIASALPDAQEAAMKKQRPGAAQWWQVAEACEQDTITQHVAIFDVATAGVLWEEDLFAEPGSPGQFYTRDIPGFMAAQRKALEEKVAAYKGKVTLAAPSKTDGYPEAPRNTAYVGWTITSGEKLPRGAQAIVALSAGGHVQTRAWKPLPTAKPTQGDTEAAEDDDDADDAEEEAAATPPPRPAPPPVEGITHAGREMLATTRTNALRARLRGTPRPLEVATATLLLALAAKNLRVDGEPGSKWARTSFEDIAGVVFNLMWNTPDGGTDAHLARLASEAAARVLICAPAAAGNASGDAAEWVGQIVRAEEAMPRLDTPEFLATLGADRLRDIAARELGDAKAAKLSAKVLRERLAGNAPRLDATMAELVIFNAPPPAEDDADAFTGPCGKAGGKADCDCGWERDEPGDACASEEAAAARARLAPWPNPTPTAPPADAPVAEACAWDGKTRCPRHSDTFCADRCPRMTEYDRWWESPAGGAAQPQAPATQPAPPACAWDGKSVCPEEGTFVCTNCPRFGDMAVWTKTLEGKKARRAHQAAEAKAARGPARKGKR